VIAEIGLAHATPASFHVGEEHEGNTGLTEEITEHGAEPAELADLAYMYGARRGIAKGLGMGVLLSELEEVYRQILELRATSEALRV